RSAPQVLCPSVFGLAFLARGVIEIICFDGPFQLPLHFIGQGSIPQPPAPAIARPAMHPQLSRNTARRAREAQQEGGKNPVGQRALALVEQRIGEIIEGALTAVVPVAFAAGSVVVRAPRIDVLALAPGTLEWSIFPSQCMNVGVTLVAVEEFVQV